MFYEMLLWVSRLDFVGINKLFCTQAQKWRVVQFWAGVFNDWGGPQAFTALDRQMKKYYIQNY